MTFPTYQRAAELLETGEQPLDSRAEFVTPELSLLLAMRSCAITTIRGAPLDSVLLGATYDRQLKVAVGDS